MKCTLLVLLGFTGANAMLAQTAPAPPPNTISSGPTNSVPSGNSAAGPTGLTFTNQAGTVYSVGQLDEQLRNLQAVVEQTLPMVTAFNQHVAASGGPGQELAGALSRVLSGNRGTTSPVVTNLLGAVRGLVTTNNATASLNPTTLANLQTLQRDLEPLPSLLQNLNAGGSAPGTYSSTAPTGTNYYRGATNYPGGLAPTGR